MNTKDAILDAYQKGVMVNCHWPGCDGIRLGITRNQIDGAMALWTAMDAPARAQRMASIAKEMKRGTKRVKTGRASQAQANNLAADVALWLAHELVFGNGERWLIKGPSVTEVKEMFAD
jgi:hypothetical protein